MKRSFVITLAVVALFACSTLSAAGSREDRRLQHGKITKNEAQHLVLKKYPGATINKCVLQSGHGQEVWKVEVMKAGTKEVTRMQVNGRSGQVTP
ncbi:MAG: PepSY domain-containing protein [Chthoniobacterales bacterium]